MSKRKIFVIGRHSAVDLEDDFEIVEHRAVVFPSDPVEAGKMLAGLHSEAFHMGAQLVLQAVPNQLLPYISGIASEYSSCGWGAVVSVPGPRPANVERRFEFRSGDDAEAAKAAIEFANPRADVRVDGKYVIISVTPPMRFEYDRVVWF